MSWDNLACLCFQMPQHNVTPLDYTLLNKTVLDPPIDKIFGAVNIIYGHLFYKIGSTNTFIVTISSLNNPEKALKTMQQKLFHDR